MNIYHMISLFVPYFWNNFHISYFNIYSYFRINLMNFLSYRLPCRMHVNSVYRKPLTVYMMFYTISVEHIALRIGSERVHLYFWKFMSSYYSWSQELYKDQSVVFFRAFLLYVALTAQQNMLFSI